MGEGTKPGFRLRTHLRDAEALRRARADFVTASEAEVAVALAEAVAGDEPAHVSRSSGGFPFAGRLYAASLHVPGGTTGVQFGQAMSCAAVKAATIRIRVVFWGSGRQTGQRLTVRDVSDLLTNDESAIGLDRAALDIARLEYPDLDPEPWLRVLDELAFQIADHAGDLSDNRRFVETANRHLFRTVGLRGNQSEYYDVRNSCLNDVLDRRLGIPITLSVVYIEIARRLAKPVFGIGLPSHFIVQFDDGDLSVFIDPFHGGRFLSKDDCVKLVAERTGAPPHDSTFLPFSPRRIALRMLQNLKAIYVREQQYAKALRVFDLLLSGAPAAEEYKQRAVVNLRMRRMRDAKADLETYLSLAPQALDRAEVLVQIEAIHRYLAAVN